MKINCLFIVIFSMIMLSLFPTKCYSCGSSHQEPLENEYSAFSLPLPSVGLNGGQYIPPESGGFVHSKSVFIQSFWIKVGQYVTGTIYGGYRCPVRNSQLPNAGTKSYHMYGNAADVQRDGQNYNDLINNFAKVIPEDVPYHYHIDDRTY